MVLELDPENKGISIQTEFPCYSIQFQDEPSLKKTLEEITSKHGQICFRKNPAGNLGPGFESQRNRLSRTREKNP